MPFPPNNPIQTPGHCDRHCGCYKHRNEKCCRCGARPDQED